MKPLISCLCISKNNYDIVKDSIISFKKQTYLEKELIFLYEDNNIYIDKIKLGLKGVATPSEKKSGG